MKKRYLFLKETARVFCLLLTLCLFTSAVGALPANAYEEEQEMYSPSYISYTGGEETMESYLYYDEEGRLIANMENVSYNISGSAFSNANAYWYTYDGKGNLDSVKGIVTGAQCPVTAYDYQHAYRYDGTIMSTYSTFTGGLGDFQTSYSFRYNGKRQITSVTRCEKVTWEIGGDTEITTTQMELSYSEDNKTVTLLAYQPNTEDSEYTVTYDLTCFPIVISRTEGSFETEYKVAYSPTWNQQTCQLYVFGDYTVEADPEEQKITLTNEQDPKDVYTYSYG